MNMECILAETTAYKNNARRRSLKADDQNLTLISLLLQFLYSLQKVSSLGFV